MYKRQIIIRRNGSLDILISGNPPIGTRDLRLVDEQIAFPEEKRKLNSGDKLILYTDGVFEYQNHQGDFYGYEQFHRQLIDLNGRPIANLVDLQFQALMEFGNGMAPKDDISLLGIEFKN